MNTSDAGEAPVEQAVVPGGVDALHLELVAGFSVDLAMKRESEWRRLLKDVRDITAIQLALLRLSMEVQRLRHNVELSRARGPGRP